MIPLPFTLPVGIIEVHVSGLCAADMLTTESGPRYLINRCLTTVNMGHPTLEAQTEHNVGQEADNASDGAGYQRLIR
jgi:hypothetical protein